MSNQNGMKKNAECISFERFFEIINDYCNPQHLCKDENCDACRDYKNGLRGTYDTISRRNYAKVTTRDAANVGATIRSQLPETEW